MVGARLRVHGHVCQLDNVQLYEQGDGTILREYRPRDEVASVEALDSMRSIPLTIQHPSAMIDAGNWARYAKGNLGDDPAIDVMHVKATLWVHDEEAIRRIQSEELVELSLGYFARLEMTPGIAPDGQRYDAIQRGHRYNHLALLEEGQARGGPTVRLIDGEQRTVTRLDSRGDVERFSRPADADQEEEEMKVTITVDGIDYEIEADRAFAQALEKERADSKASIDAEKSRADNAEARRDAETERADGLKVQLDETTAKLTDATDPATIAKAAQELAAAIADAKLVAGDTFDAVGSIADIRRAVVKSAGIDVEGRSDGYIDGRYDVLIETAKAKREAGARAESDLADARGAARAPKTTDATDEPVARVFSISACQAAVLDGAAVKEG